MDSVTQSVYVKGSQDKVFNAFVKDINHWWPFKGKFNYSFAPEETTPAEIHFEPRPGGRFYEIFANGDEFQIGEVRSWQPPDQFSFTWKGEEYKQATLVEVVFHEAEGQTLVTLSHSGWAAAGVSEYAEGYASGWDEILSRFANWVVAR